MRLLSIPVFAAALLACACSGQAADTSAPAREREAASTHTAKESMKIRIVAGSREFTATLEDNAAARDFATLLPLELILRDYNRTEKIADLPKHLSTQGAPDGIDPEIGDLAYYAPWGNLAIFYRDFSHSRGLVRLGHLEGGIEYLAARDGGPIRIERLP